MDWQTFLDSVWDDAQVLIKDEIKKTIKDAQADTDAFVKEQAGLVPRYLEQLANNQITKDQFHDFLADMRDMVQMKLDQHKIAAAATAQRLVTGVLDILLEKFRALV